MEVVEDDECGATAPLEADEDDVEDEAVLEEEEWKWEWESL